MNIFTDIRRRVAAVAAAVLVLLVGAVTMVSVSTAAPPEGAGATAVQQRPTDDPGSSAGNGRDAGATSGDGRPADQGNGQGAGDPAADRSGAAASGENRGRSLSEVAGRAPSDSARADAARNVEKASGLAQAAGRSHADKVPGRAQRHGETDPTKGLTERGAVTPDAVLGQDGALGGCAPAYGTDGQCLPSVPPSLADHVADMRKAGMDPATMDHSWSCGEVRTYFPEGITVRAAGVDPQGLDADGDGLACGPGD